MDLREMDVSPRIRIDSARDREFNIEPPGSISHAVSFTCMYKSQLYLSGP